MTERRPEPPDPVEEPRDEPSHTGPRGPRPDDDDRGLPDDAVRVTGLLLEALSRLGYRVVAIDRGRGPLADALESTLGPASQSIGLAYLAEPRPEGVPVPDLDGPSCLRCGTPSASCRYCAPVVAWCN